MGASARQGAADLAAVALADVEGAVLRYNCFHVFMHLSGLTGVLCHSRCELRVRM